MSGHGKLLASETGEIFPNELVHSAGLERSIASKTNKKNSYSIEAMYAELSGDGSFRIRARWDLIVSKSLL